MAIKLGAGERSGEISRGIETYSSISAFAELEIRRIPVSEGPRPVISRRAYLFQLLEGTGLLRLVHFLWNFGSRWPRWFFRMEEKMTRRDQI